MGNGNLLLLHEWMDFLLTLPEKDIGCIIVAIYKYAEFDEEIDILSFKSSKARAFLIGAMPTLKSRKYGKQGGYHAHKSARDTHMESAYSDEHWNEYYESSKKKSLEPFEN